MDYLYISLTFFLLVVSFWKMSLLPFPTGIIIILFVSQVVFLLTHDGVMTCSLYDIVHLGGLTRQYDYTQFLYSSLATFCYLTSIRFSKKIESGRVGNAIGNYIKNFAPNRRTTLLLLIFLLIQFGLFLLVTDWRKLWFHPNYLSPISDDEVVAVLGNIIPSIIIKTAIFFLFISTFGFLFSKNSNFLVRTIFFSIALFYYFLFLGIHSRGTVVVPVIIGLFAFLNTNRCKFFMIPLIILVCIIDISSALMGRSLNVQGFSSIPLTMVRVFNGDLKNSLNTILLNVNEGIFETAEGLQLTNNFDELYKLLCFSPLPSAIDNYDSIKQTNQVRLHLYVPLPGLAEIHLFGWPYFCAMIFIYFVIIRAHLGIQTKNVMSYILCNFLIMFSIYHLLAYPLRNALHFAWLVFAFTVITYSWPNKNTSYFTPDTKIDSDFQPMLPPNFFHR
ncbi:MAG: hypothetical protein P4L42_15255 [Desulfocapsaceae bacterium]|nr:hypothetical protein [Desulfocapsaceae bacterium]